MRICNTAFYLVPVLFLTFGCNAGQVHGAGGRMGGKILHSCLLLPPLQHWGLRRQVRGDIPYFLLVDDGAEPRVFLMYRYPAISWHDPCPVLLIRIRIHLAVLDQDPYCECGSGSRSMEIDRNLQIDLVSCLSKQLLYLRRYRMFFDLLPTLSIFFMKKSTFCDLEN